MDYATEAAVPGKYLVDIIPASQHHSLVLASSVSLLVRFSEVHPCVVPWRQLPEDGHACEATCARDAR